MDLLAVSQEGENVGDFSLLPNIHANSGTHPDSHLMDLLAVSQEGEKMGHEADNSSLPTTEIKKCGEMNIFIFMLHYALGQFYFYLHFNIIYHNYKRNQKIS
jgi:hypothetical protein